MAKICCKIKAGMYKSKQIFMLSDFELVENEIELTPNKYNTISRKLTNSLFDNNTFTILKRNTNGNSNANKTLTLPSNPTAGAFGQTSVQFVFKTMADKNTWKQLVKKAMFVFHNKSFIFIIPSINFL
jgi:hypothetical protein